VFRHAYLVRSGRSTSSAVSSPSDIATCDLSGEKLVYWGREGAIIRWVHEEGDHLTVVSECEQNARPAFTQALQELLEVDISDSSSWESNLTPPSESNLTTRPPSTRDSRES